LIENTKYSIFSLKETTFHAMSSLPIRQLCYNLFYLSNPIYLQPNIVTFFLLQSHPSLQKYRDESRLSNKKNRKHVFHFSWRRGKLRKLRLFDSRWFKCLWLKFSWHFNMWLDKFVILMYIKSKLGELRCHKVITEILREFDLLLPSSLKCWTCTFKLVTLLLMALQLKFEDLLKNTYQENDSFVIPSRMSLISPLL